MKVFTILPLAALAAAQYGQYDNADGCSTGYDDCEAGFPNGNFTVSNNLDDWDFSPFSDDPIPSGQYAGREPYGLEPDFYNTVTIDSLYIIVPHNQGFQSTEFSTDVTFCSKTQYSFDLNPFHDEGFTGFDPCTLTMSFADQTIINKQSLGGFAGWNQARLDAPVSYAKDVLKRELIVGPFSRRTPGVEKDGRELYVPFKVAVECNGTAASPPWAKLRLANFKITPV